MFLHTNSLNDSLDNTRKTGCVLHVVCLYRSGYIKDITQKWREHAEIGRMAKCEPTLMFKSEFLLCKGLIVPKILRICNGMMQLNQSLKLRLTGNFVSSLPG